MSFILTLYFSDNTKMKITSTTLENIFPSKWKKLNAMHKTLRQVNITRKDGKVLLNLGVVDDKNMTDNEFLQVIGTNFNNAKSNALTSTPTAPTSSTSVTPTAPTSTSSSSYKSGFKPVHKPAHKPISQTTNKLTDKTRELPASTPAKYRNHFHIDNQTKQIAEKVKKNCDKPLPSDTRQQVFSTNNVSSLPSTDNLPPLPTPKTPDNDDIYEHSDEEVEDKTEVDESFQLPTFEYPIAFLQQMAYDLNNMITKINDYANQAEEQGEQVEQTNAESNQFSVPEIPAVPPVEPVVEPVKKTNSPEFMTALGYCRKGFYQSLIRLIFANPNMNLNEDYQDKGLLWYADQEAKSKETVLVLVLFGANVYNLEGTEVYRGTYNPGLIHSCRVNNIFVHHTLATKCTKLYIDNAPTGTQFDNIMKIYHRYEMILAGNYNRDKTDNAMFLAIAVYNIHKIAIGTVDLLMDLFWSENREYINVVIDGQTPLTNAINNKVSNKTLLRMVQCGADPLKKANGKNVCDITSENDSFELLHARNKFVSRMKPEFYAN